MEKFKQSVESVKYIYILSNWGKLRERELGEEIERYQERGRESGEVKRD